MKNGMKAVSLFSGAGGLDIGVEQSGFDILACIEQDPNCCNTLRRNFGARRVIEKDIRKVDPQSLLTDTDLVPGELDLLFGGPPCQSFSQIGKQAGINDERGMLLFEMSRFAKVFKPKTILIEQVKGLLSAKDETGKPGGVINQLVAELSSLGYIVKWKVLNSAEYGIPQLRKRVFIVGTLGFNGFYFPSPTHEKQNGIPSLLGLNPFRNVGEVILDLDDPAEKGESPEIPGHLDITPSGDRRRIKGVPEGQCLAKQIHLPPEQLGKLTKKDTTKFLRTSYDNPSNTLRGGEIFFHPIEDRYLTPREYMRIHGYPDSYILEGPIRGRSGSYKNLDQHRQVANSVPPPLAKILASEIKKILPTYV